MWRKGPDWYWVLDIFAWHHKTSYFQLQHLVKGAQSAPRAESTTTRRQRKRLFYADCHFHFDQVLCMCGHYQSCRFIWICSNRTFSSILTFLELNLILDWWVQKWHFQHKPSSGWCGKLFIFAPSASQINILEGNNRIEFLPACSFTRQE